MRVWKVARVLARSKSCAGHEPAFAAHSGGGVPTVARPPAATATVASTVAASSIRTALRPMRDDPRAGCLERRIGLLPDAEVEPPQRLARDLRGDGVDRHAGAVAELADRPDRA